MSQHRPYIQWVDPAAATALRALAGEAHEDWRDDALCAETDPEEFFPEKGGSNRAAKRICARCPVTAECLEYALEHDERYGLWGGLSERERRRIRRTANREAA